MSFQRMWRDLDNAGDRKAQINALMALWITASRAFVQGAEDLRTKAELFLQRLASWRDDLMSAFRGQPFDIFEDVERAKKYFWGGVAALIGETVLGTAIAARNGLPIWSGALIAFGASVFFDAAFVLAWLRAKRYREALDKLRRFLLFPSLLLFGFALPILLLGRMVRGLVAAELAPVVSVSLWLTTLSLLILGATLFACSFIYAWSKREKKEFDTKVGGQTALQITMDKVIRELESRGVDTDPLIDKLRKDLQRRNLLGFPWHPNAGTHSPVGLLSSAAAKVKLLPAVLLVAAVLPNSSCNRGIQSTTSGVPPTSAEQVTANDGVTPPGSVASANPGEGSPLTTEILRAIVSDAFNETDFIIGIDGTGSTHPSANQMIAMNLKRDAPRLLMAEGAATLRIYEFVENGRVPRERANFDLPKFIRPKSSKSEVGDAGIMENIQEGVAENDRNKTNAELDSALMDYASKMNRALAGLSVDKLTPINGTQPTCSDINGFLAFVTTVSGDRPRRVVVVTDGEENCSDGIKSLDIPKDLTLVIAVLPLSPEESRDDSGLDIHFQQRLDGLQKSLPSAMVIPYNASIYKALVGSKRDSTQSVAKQN